MKDDEEGADLGFQSGESERCARSCRWLGGRAGVCGGQIDDRRKLCSSGAYGGEAAGEVEAANEVSESGMTGTCVAVWMGSSSVGPFELSSVEKLAPSTLACDRDTSSPGPCVASSVFGSVGGARGCGSAVVSGGASLGSSGAGVCAVSCEVKALGQDISWKRSHHGLIQGECDS